MRKKEWKGNKYPVFSLTKGLQKLLPVLLTCVLLAGTVQTYVRAEEPSPEQEEETDGNKEAKVTKEEVVYGAMSLSGEVKDLYVVNAFTFPYDGMMEDYGNYSRVKNLTDLAPLKDEDGIVSAEVKKGRFYYQGELKKKEFPWDIEISYTVNGKERDPEMIGGASGRVGIDIKTSRNPDVDPVFYEKYVLVISVTLNTDTCDRIKAKGAMVTNTGSDKMLNFIAMPEKESEFKVKLRTKNFSMKGMTFAAMPASLDKDMFAFDKINEMTEGLKKLSEGISDLSDGADSLDAGMQEFSGGADRLNDGLSRLHGGIEQLSDGAGQLADGAAGLKEGSSQFKAGLDQLNAGSDELAAGSAQINDVFQGIKKMADMLHGIDMGGITKLRDELKSLCGSLNEARGEFADLAEKIRDSLKLTGFQYISEAESAQALAELTRLAAEGKLSPSTLTVYTKLMGNYLIAASADMFLNCSDRLQEWTDKFLERLNERIDSFEDVGILLPDALLDISGMIDTFADQFQMFHNGIVQYTGGVKALAANYNEIDKGIQGLSDGAAGISGGLKETEDGSRQMLDGASGFAGGAGRLAGGMSDLASGIRQLNDQTSSMPSQVQGGIDDMFGKFCDPDFKPVSFSSPKNGQIEAVQFVATTEEIEGTEEEKEEEKKPEKKSFGQKLMDLFRFGRE